MMVVGEISGPRLFKIASALNSPISNDKKGHNLCNRNLGWFVIKLRFVRQSHEDNSRSPVELEV